MKGWIVFDDLLLLLGLLGIVCSIGLRSLLRKLPAPDKEAAGSAQATEDLPAARRADATGHPLRQRRSAGCAVNAAPRRRRCR